MQLTPTQKAIKGILTYFESGNGVPVDKATIRADCAEVAALRAASEALDKGVKDLLKRRVLPALQAENEVSPADVGNFVASRTGGTYYKSRLELWVNTSVERLGYAIREAIGPLTAAKVEIAKVGQLRPTTPAHKTTGWVAPKNHYAVPVLFNPYTGEPRDVRDVQSDPQGVMVIPPGKVEVLAAQKDAEAHLDDMAVDKFAAAMKAKMAKQRVRGYSGWHDEEACPIDLLQQMLVDHVAKGDPVDVGNLAMMLWNRDAPTAAAKVAVCTAPQAQQPAPADVPLLTDGERFDTYQQAMRGYYIDSLHYWLHGPAHKYAIAIEQAVRQKAGLKCHPTRL